MSIVPTDNDAGDGKQLKFSIRDEFNNRILSRSALETEEIGKFVSAVANQLQFGPNSFDLYLESQDSTQSDILLRLDNTSTFAELGVHIKPKIIKLFARESEGTPLVELGTTRKRSASMECLNGDVDDDKNIIVTGTAAGGAVSSVGTSTSYYNRNSNWSTAGVKSQTGFAGLANQGATCYLNSLLQSLFMTPEFRTALYNWTPDEGSTESEEVAKASEAQEVVSDESDPNAVVAMTNGDEGEENIDSNEASKKDIKSSIHYIPDKNANDSDDDDDNAAEGDADTSIPEELQHLFINLQTTSSRAASTKAITKSFGWDSSEAFQQHDVQELLRVLFDALEHEWKGTSLETVIRDLYEGKMSDYVKCCECGYESKREDKYMDIPLVIKPFGSSRILQSVQEALRFFAQVEKLEGDNQYECSQCKKKVDALKGLKLVSLPYILTLQLKRFDFDLQTFRRIKLNNRFEFPFFLDMKSYLNASFSPDDVSEEGQNDSDSDSDGGFSSPQESAPPVYSVHDAMSKMKLKDEDDQSGDNSENDENDDVTGQQPQQDTVDEDGTDTTETQGDELEMEEEDEQDEESNPYIYELYSVMIHSGSALGGHYYAYIKDLNDGKWYCFNDSSVTEASTSDVESAFGGARQNYNSYYSSSYMSSSSAYMLMYRQVDKSKNQLLPTDIPSHLKQALETMSQREQERKDEENRKKRLVTLKVHFQDANNAVTEKGKKFKVDKELTFGEVIEGIREHFDINADIDTSRLRFCKYLPYRNQIDHDYDNTAKLESIGVSYQYTFYDVVLQIADENGEFPESDAGKTVLSIIQFDSETRKFRDPIKVSVPDDARLSDMKNVIAEALEWDEEKMIVAKYMYHNSDPIAITINDRTMRQAYIYSSQKLFVALDDTSPLDFRQTDLCKEMDRQANIIKLFVVLPGEDQESEGHPVEVDKRMKLQKFKEEVVAKMADLDPLQFLLFRFRSYMDDPLVELTNLDESLNMNTLQNNGKVWAKRGVACKPGQYPYIINLWNPLAEEPYIQLFDRCPARKGVQAVEFLKDVIEHLENQKKNEDFKYKDLELPELERLRLWSSYSGRLNQKYYPDRLISSHHYNQTALTVEILPEGMKNEKMPGYGDWIYLREFNGQTLELGPCQPFYLESQDGEKGFKAIAEFTGIPREFLELVDSPSVYVPFDATKLELSDLHFYDKVIRMASAPLYVNGDGCCLYYRDNRVEIQKLSDDEVKKLKEAEAKEAAASNAKSAKQNRRYYRTEKALVINKRKKKKGDGEEDGTNSGATSPKPGDEDEVDDENDGENEECNAEELQTDGNGENSEARMSPETVSDVTTV